MVQTDPTTTWQGVTREELGQAARNHAMHLEGAPIRPPPPGMHYLVIHFDILDADETAWTVEVDGLVDHPLTLLDRRPPIASGRHPPVTMECAGNGRALMPPRAESQPWLDGAVGNAEWTGTPLPPLLEEAVFRPMPSSSCSPAPITDPGRRRADTSGASLSTTSSARRSPRLRDERAAAAAAARLPGPIAGSRLVRDVQREVAAAPPRWPSRSTASSSRPIAAPEL